VAVVEVGLLLLEAQVEDRAHGTHLLDRGHYRVELERQDRAMQVELVDNLMLIIFTMGAVVAQQQLVVMVQVQEQELVGQEGLDNTLQYQALILLMRVVVVVGIKLILLMLQVE
jgi:hypothetical protein